ncbi:MAG: class I SAM-dependent methyltransferase [Bdellovibrionales bacterium]|nr:class I SAM-dependent methyltransferase [Bdellovibrionales bacterium]
MLAILKEWSRLSNLLAKNPTPKDEQVALTRYQNLENPQFIEQQEQMALMGLHPHEESFFNQRLDGISKNLPLLVVGCGCGRQAIALAQKGYAVDGIDDSASLVRRARSLSTVFNLPLHFDCKSLTELPDSKKYGLIFVTDSLINLIPSFELRVAFLQKAKQLLVPAGILCLETDFLLLSGANRFQMAHEFFPNKKALNNEMRASGFVDPQDYEDFFWAKA